MGLSIVTSTEGLEQRLSGMYVQYLHRTAAPEDLTSWSYWLQNGFRDEQIIVTMLAQERYPNSVLAS